MGDVDHRPAITDRPPGRRRPTRRLRRGPVTGAFRIAILVAAACVMAIVPTVLDNFAGSSRNLTIARYVGYGIAALGVLGAVTMRGREVSVHRGDIIVRHLRAPLRPESERRIPGTAIRDVSARAATRSDDLLTSGRRFVVVADLTGSPARVRLMTARDEAQAHGAAMTIRDALRASGSLTPGPMPA